MLAQNFKTADDLGLTKRGHAAMIRVLAMLERDELVYAERRGNVPNGFNMRVVINESECGTVCCIAGWATKLGGGSTVEKTNIPRSKREGYSRLIMPPKWQSRVYTVEQAAHALRNFLTTGEPSWEEVVAAR